MFLAPEGNTLGNCTKCPGARHSIRPGNEIPSRTYRVSIILLHCRINIELMVNAVVTCPPNFPRPAYFFIHERQSKIHTTKIPELPHHKPIATRTPPPQTRRAHLCNLGRKKKNGNSWSKRPATVRPESNVMRPESNENDLYIYIYYMCVCVSSPLSLPPALSLSLSRSLSLSLPLPASMNPLAAKRSKSGWNDSPNPSHQMPSLITTWGHDQIHPDSHISY